MILGPGSSVDPGARAPGRQRTPVAGVLCARTSG